MVMYVYFSGSCFCPDASDPSNGIEISYERQILGIKSVVRLVTVIPNDVTRDPVGDSAMVSIV